MGTLAIFSPSTCLLPITLSSLHSHSGRITVSRLPLNLATGSGTDLFVDARITDIPVFLRAASGVMGLDNTQTATDWHNYTTVYLKIPPACVTFAHALVFASVVHE